MAARDWRNPLGVNWKATSARFEVEAASPELVSMGVAVVGDAEVHGEIDEGAVVDVADHARRLIFDLAADI